MTLRRIILVCSVAALVAVSALLSQQSPQLSAKSFTVASGLAVSTWATEPALVNPTNIDIDARGRIWVLEGVNYRRQLKGEKGYRPACDGIVILEDADHDGKAEKVKVFDQNPQLRSPLGIAVLGDKVVVSQSPDMIVYTKDEDDRIIKKEVLLN